MTPENRLGSKLIEFVLRILSSDISFEVFHLSDESTPSFDMKRNLVLILWPVYTWNFITWALKKLVLLNKKVTKSCNNGAHIAFYGKSLGHCFHLIKTLYVA